MADENLISLSDPYNLREGCIIKFTHRCEIWKYNEYTNRIKNLNRGIWKKLIGIPNPDCTLNYRAPSFYTGVYPDSESGNLPPFTNGDELRKQLEVDDYAKVREVLFHAKKTDEFGSAPNAFHQSLWVVPVTRASDDTWTEDTGNEGFAWTIYRGEEHAKIVDSSLRTHRRHRVNLSEVDIYFKILYYNPTKATEDERWMALPSGLNIKIYDNGTFGGDTELATVQTNGRKEDPIHVCLHHDCRYGADIFFKVETEKKLIKLDDNTLKDENSSGDFPFLRLPKYICSANNEIEDRDREQGYGYLPIYIGKSEGNSNTLINQREGYIRVPSDRTNRTNVGTESDPWTFKVSVDQRKILPIIFLPGIMGTRLEASNGELLWDPDSEMQMIGLSNQSVQAKRNLIGITGPNSTAKVINDTRNITIGASRFREHDRMKRGLCGPSPNFYGDLLIGLDERFGFGSEHANTPDALLSPVWAIGYDWRQKIEDCSRYVTQELDKIENELSRNKAYKFQKNYIMITHSMGGLVARQVMKDSGYHDKVKAVIHVTQPVVGAPKLYGCFKTGAKPYGSGFADGILAGILGDTPEKFQDLACLLPGAIYLAPSNDYRFPGCGGGDTQKYSHILWNSAIQTKLEELRNANPAYGILADVLGSTAQITVDGYNGVCYAGDDIFKLYKEESGMLGMMRSSVREVDRDRCYDYLDDANAFHKGLYKNGQLYCHPNTFNMTVDNNENTVVRLQPLRELNATDINNRSIYYRPRIELSSDDIEVEKFGTVKMARGDGTVPITSQAILNDVTPAAHPHPFTQGEHGGVCNQRNMIERIRDTIVQEIRTAYARETAW